MSTRKIRGVGCLIAATGTVAVWLFVTIVVSELTNRWLIPFQIFPGRGVSLLAIAISALAAMFIFNHLTEREGCGYAALLTGLIFISALLVLGSLVGIYAVLDESPPQRVRLEGRFANTYSIWFSADGSELVGQGAESGHPVIRRWDARTGRLQSTVRLVTDDYLWLYDAAFSPDGLTVATYEPSEDTVTLWDVPTGSLRLGPLAAGDHCCTSIIFSPDSRTLVAVGDRGYLKGGAVRLWDARTGEIKRTLPGELAAFSPDGRAFAVRDQMGEAIRVWDALTSELKVVLPVERHSRASVLVFSPDGRMLIGNAPNAAVDKEPDLGVWDLQTGRFELKLEGRRPRTLAFSPDGRLIALNDGHMLEIYEASTWRRLRRFQPYENQVGTTTSGRAVRSRHSTTWPRTIAFSPDGKTLVTTANSDVPKLWDVSELYGGERPR